MAVVALAVRDQIEAFKPYIGVIQALRDPGMKTRHFEELNNQTGIQMALTPSLTLKNLLLLGVMEFEETVRTIGDAAAKEYSIESMLDKMMAEWKTITMDVIPYKNTGTISFSCSLFFQERINKCVKFCIFNMQYITENIFI